MLISVIDLEGNEHWINPAAVTIIHEDKSEPDKGTCYAIIFNNVTMPIWVSDSTRNELLRIINKDPDPFTVHMTLKEKLIADIETNGGSDSYSITELPYEWEFSVPIYNPGPPPTSNLEEDEILDYDPEDPWDFENFEIYSVDLENSTVDVCGGGDWQDPLRMVLKYENDKFTPVEGTIIQNASFDEGLTTEELNVILEI